MKLGNFWNPSSPVTANEVGRVITYLTVPTPECSWMVHHWEASKFALHPRKAQELQVIMYLKRQGWGRALNQMYLRLQKIGHRRGQRWDMRLRTGVRWKVYRLTAAQLPSSQKTGIWEMLKRYWRVLGKMQILTCGFPNQKAGLPIDYPVVGVTA